MQSTSYCCYGFPDSSKSRTAQCLPRLVGQSANTAQKFSREAPHPQHEGAFDPSPPVTRPQGGPAESH